MRSHRGGARSLPLLLLMVASLVWPSAAAAAPAQPIAIGPAEFEVTRIDERTLANGKLEIIIDVIGAGLVDCQDNVACSDAGLDGSEVTVGLGIVSRYDTVLGRVSGRGRIVIDVISAGFKGSVTGTLEPESAGVWAVALSVSARSTGGNRASFELDGWLNPKGGDPIIKDLSGSGIVTQDNVDQV